MAILFFDEKVKHRITKYEFTQICEFLNRINYSLCLIYKVIIHNFEVVNELP
jgi:hypothetical protein